jgi:hypothetical protein
MRESQFQAKLIKDLKELFPGCVVIKNDPNYQQGFPDLLILYKRRWAALECKASESSSQQPNQAYWVDTLEEMSYAAFINPSNREQVISGLQQALRTRR